MIFSLFADICHPLLCSALFVTLAVLEIFCCKIAVFIQRFPMGQDNLVSFVGPNRKFHISGQILSIINYGFTIWRLYDFPFKPFSFCNWKTVGAHKIFQAKRFRLNRMKLRYFFQHRIISLALLHIIFPEGAILGGCPVLI